MDFKGGVKVGERAGAVLAAGGPVVGLETAVLTHGLPKVAALGIYFEMMDAVSAAGAFPAPVAVLDGVVRVGLERDEVEALFRRDDAVKAADRDLPGLLVRGGWGGATVGASLLALKAAGVEVFATGGIGGVHRGVVESFDVSGDMAALARFGGCVVCSGAKILCDIPKTAELLETLGIPVAGYRTNTLPAFTVADSGVRLRDRVDSPEEAAAFYRAARALYMPQAMIVANPPPVDFALDAEAAQAALRGAFKIAEEMSASGPDATPAILAGMAKLTGGASVAANGALLVSNAGLAARIAVKLR